MQEAVLQAAEAAGAEVRRGASVRNIQPGQVPSVVIAQDECGIELRARIIVGVDGRASMMRKWAGFAVQYDPEKLFIAGVLFEAMPIPPEDTSYVAYNTKSGLEALLFPQGHGRVRAYLVYNRDVPYRLRGATHMPLFIEESVRAGVPAEWYAGVQPIGPSLPIVVLRRG
jgi:flavin-dependent dehydrogenase